MYLPRLCAALLVLAGALGAAVPAAAADPDPAAIRHVLMATFDKPESRLQVDPVVVVGDHALAGWAQGERGGHALLRRHGSPWQVALCGGDGLKDTALLREAGVAASDANALSAGQVAAESRLPAAQRARFSTFDGLVHMDAAGHHPPQHPR